MIGIYYTGAQLYSDAQSDPKRSLGGWISSSKVPNLMNNNVFDEISLLSRQRELTETRALVIKNESKNNLTNILLWALELPSDGEYSCAIVNPGYDERCQGYYLETIPNPYATPYYAEFDQLPLDEENAWLIATTIKPNEYVGIWLRRKVSNQSIDCDQMLADFEAKNQKQAQKLSLKFKWS